MCIIVNKPRGVKLPSTEILKRCWEVNSDGAGFMYNTGKEVVIRKGFMTFESFERAIQKLKKVDKLNLVMHFRITTHGGTSPENCHPFPMSNKVAELRSTRTSTHIGITHNGIIPITAKKGISDTMQYILSELYYLSEADQEFYKDAKLKKMISNRIDSKLCILPKAGKAVMIGNFNEHEGCFYSNYSWEKRSYTMYDYHYMIDDDYIYYDDLEATDSPVKTATVPFKYLDGVFSEETIKKLERVYFNDYEIQAMEDLFDEWEVLEYLKMENGIEKLFVEIYKS